MKNKEENEFLFSLMSITGKFGYGPFIGGHDRKTDGEWYWDQSGEKIA